MKKASLIAVLAHLFLVAGCVDDPAHTRASQSARAPAGGEPGETRDLSSAEAANVMAAVLAHADTVDKKLRRVPNLSRSERRTLLADVNDVQTSRARQVGIPRGSSVDQLTRSGRLVQLADTTAYWMLRDLEYSVPYVTPATAALLEEIGKRFHQRLDSLGIPRYRLEITSVLRTPEKQSALRKRNANAAREVSAHEFGTTVDIAYRKWGPPAMDTIAGLPITSELRIWSDSVMAETARQRGAELQAVLGRVLRQLRTEGRVLVRMERRQTVYHITTARATTRKRA
ncbi:MAG TPA: DUF5715 family protein [Longimicrobiales bacterium]